MGDLSFSIEHQQHDQWCWAAVAISICRFCNVARWSEQCDLVNEIFAAVRGGDVCCQDGDSDNCNVPWSLSDVLNTAGLLSQPTQGVVSFDDLSQQIEGRGKPVALRVIFADLMTRHFIVVVGCSKTDDGQQWVRVADPSWATGNSTSIEYADLLSSYRENAAWDESYFLT
jgi:hypothetical protein